MVCTTAALGIVAVAGLLTYRRTSAPPPAAAPHEQPKQDSGEANLPGILRAQNVIDIEALTDGTIETLDAGVGDEVYEGQLLARISSQAIESEHERARAAVEAARERMASLQAAITATRLEASRARADANRARRDSDRLEKVFERQQMLMREGATPRLMFEKAQREFQNAQTEFRSLDEIARQPEERIGEMVKDLELSQRIFDDKAKQLEEAQSHRAAAEIRSPVDGLVVVSRGEVGRAIEGHERNLFRIAVDVSALEAVLDPEPPLLPRFRPGQPALILTADIPGDGIPGQVKAVENNQVVVEFVSPTPLLKPGMQVQVRVKIGPAS